MGWLNRLRRKTKKNNWRKRSNVARSSWFVNNAPKVNKSRIVGISHAKPSPTQGLQNWFVKSFTRKQKSKRPVENEFEPNFPVPVSESKVTNLPENDQFSNLSGFNSFTNKKTHKERFNHIKTRRNELQRRYKQLSVNPFTDNSNIKEFRGDIELLRKNTEALQDNVRRLKNTMNK